MGRGRCDGGSPGAPCPVQTFPPCFVGGSSHCIPPRGSWCWDPQPGPRRVWWSSLEAVCQEAAAGQGLGTTPSGLQVALSPICQHQGRSPRATCPPSRVAPAWSPPHAPSPPNSCAARPALPAVGALLFSGVTLEHKQLCSSSPVNYIMSNEQDQAEGIKP